jgi:small subunit ribosomal protein S17
MNRGNRKHVTGVVASDKMDKSVVVEVKRLVKHPLYGKYIRRRTRLMAHDEKNEAHVGDTVELAESRPTSKRKSWRVVSIVKRAVGSRDEDAAPAATTDSNEGESQS